jgi:hypothetical protein
VERLEDRTLPVGGTFATAAPLVLHPATHTAAVGGFLRSPAEVDLYAVRLTAGDTVTAAVSTQQPVSGLDPLLRVFDGTGAELAANDNFDGRDPRLTFQAPADGVYYVGVSASGNDRYDPQSGANTFPGATTGLYTLQLSDQVAAPLAPDLLGTAFQVVPGVAVPGQPLTVTYTVANRGGVGTGSAFEVDVRLSPTLDLADGPVVLDARQLGPLGPGESVTERLTVSVPAGAPSAAYLGIVVDVGDTVAESNEDNNSGQRQGLDYAPLQVLTPGTATGLNVTLRAADGIAPPSVTAGTLGSEQANYFRLTLTQPGRLDVRVHADGFAARLSLLDATGNLLIESDGQSLANPDDLIRQYLDGQPSGRTYFLRVQALTAAGGAYRLTTGFQPATPPSQPVPVSAYTGAAAVADVNGDGIPDLVTTSLSDYTVSVLLGNGDGSFQPARTFDVGYFPLAVAVADVNGDGRPDLIVMNTGETPTGTVSVLLGNGDGTFQDQQTFPVGQGPFGLAVADVNGDGRPDIITANSGDNTVSVLLGDGKGGFSPAPSSPFTVGPQPVAVAVGDFNGDGVPDIVVANNGESNVQLLLGKGDGTFTPQPPVFVDAPTALAVADVNGDGRPDVVSLSNQVGTVTVLLGDGRGLQDTPLTTDVQQFPSAMAAVDVNGDGRPDLVVGAAGPGTVQVLLGNGDGSFTPQPPRTINGYPATVAAADLNGDGAPDLIVATRDAGTVSVLLGDGGGSFQDARAGVYSGVQFPQSVTAADVNGDGIPDLIATTTLGQVSVLLGNGDGSFQDPRNFSAGFSTIAPVVADLNGDGRPDLVLLYTPAITLPGFPVSNGRVLVFLGNGDGTFQQQPDLPAGAEPAAVAVADVNGDGVPDLVVANAGDGTVGVFLGHGDGTFGAQQLFPAGISPGSVAVADVNGDGIPDLVVADAGGGTEGAGTVSVLLGKGDGSFGPPQSLPVGQFPTSVVVADVNDDGKPDIVLANRDSDTVGVLLGNGDGTFQPQQTFPVGASPRSVAAADVNGDGVPDLVVAAYNAGAVSVLLGNGDGTFQPRTDIPVGGRLLGLALADLNGDGVPDLAVGVGDVGVTVLLGTPGGRFVAGGAADHPVRPAPLVGDVNGDGVPDIVTLSRAGTILLRDGLPGSSGVFQAPLVVNPGPGAAARDVALLEGQAGDRIAALDARSASVSFYARRPDGTFTRSVGLTLPPGTEAARLLSGDLTGDGRDDLVVLDSATGRVLVYLQRPDGGYGPNPDYTLGAGNDPSAITLADVNGDGLLDIVVANRGSGDISVLLGHAGGGFAPEERFRAGSGPYFLGQDAQGNAVVDSLERTPDVVAVRSPNGTAADLIAFNHTVGDTVTRLAGTGTGGFLNPEALLLPAPVQEAAAVVGDFNGDGQPDLAILDAGTGQVRMDLADGRGGFRQTSVLDVGSTATGLALADVTGDGIPDLLVGDAQGDVLVLAGNGDGTFQPSMRTERNVGLAVADLDKDGKPDFVFANEAQDRVSVQLSSRPNDLITLADRSTGVQQPSAVAVADLNGDHIPDLVVANSGANDVQVYLGTGLSADGVPTFATPRTFAVGTAPAGVTVADVNGDGVPDLVVANEGSNDVSILFGTRAGQGGGVTFEPGPRLQAGLGPVATVVFTPPGAAVPDILVSNSGSDNVFLLPGVGHGFFNDRRPLVFPAGDSPGPLFLGHFHDAQALDLVVVDANLANVPDGSGLTYFPDFRPQSAVGLHVPSGGQNPIAAVAADFNGDGVEDVAVANNTGNVALLLGGSQGPVLSAVVPFSGTAGLSSAVSGLTNFVPPVRNVPAPVGVTAMSLSAVAVPVSAAAGAATTSASPAPTAAAASSAPAGPGGVSATPGTSVPVVATQGQASTSSGGGVSAPADPHTAAPSGGQAVETGFDPQAALLPGGLLSSGADAGLSGREDLPSGADLAGSLLTGGRPRVQLSRQKGQALAAVATIQPGEEDTGPAAAASEDEGLWIASPIGLGNPRLRRHPKVPADGGAMLPEEASSGAGGEALGEVSRSIPLAPADEAHQTAAGDLRKNTAEAISCSADSVSLAVAVALLVGGIGHVYWRECRIARQHGRHALGLPAATGPTGPRPLDTAQPNC